jgi:ABC-type nickel/cobalt efflux system permease component RcnA
MEKGFCILFLHGGSFSHAPDALFYRVQELSRPDEFGGQYRQTDRDNNHRRPRQHDHGHSSNQDCETNHYYDQAFGLSKRSKDEMSHVYFLE